VSQVGVLQLEPEALRRKGRPFFEKKQQKTFGPCGFGLSGFQKKQLLLPSLNALSGNLQLL
jgi:hypothetical protein